MDMDVMNADLIYREAVLLGNISDILVKVGLTPEERFLEAVELFGDYPNLKKDITILGIKGGAYLNTLMYAVGFWRAAEQTKSIFKSN